MRLLSLSLSIQMTERRDTGFNDPQLHQIAYSQYFEKMYYIIKTPDEPKFEEFDLTDKIRVIPSRSRNRYAFPLDALRIGKRVIREHGTDMISAQEPFGTGLIGWLLARAHGLPLCVHNVNDAIDNPQWLREEPLNRLLNPVGKFVLRRARAVRVDSNDEALKMQRLGIPEKNIWNIQFLVNGADAFLNADSADLRKSLLGDRFGGYVLFVGRFEPQKDFQTLFNLVKNVTARRPDILFVVVGSGKRDEEYRRMAADMGVDSNIHFTGWVDYFELPAYYAGADLYLMTSIHETNPRALIFARLARKAVVTTDISGARDFVTNGENGFLRPLGDDKGLSEDVLALMENPALRTRMGEHGFDYARPILDEKLILEKVYRMYSSLIT